MGTHHYAVEESANRVFHRITADGYFNGLTGLNIVRFVKHGQIHAAGKTAFLNNFRFAYRARKRNVFFQKDKPTVHLSAVIGERAGHAEAAIQTVLCRAAVIFKCLR